MKSATKEMMRQLTKELHPELPHYEAMYKIKADEFPNSAFVVLNNGNYNLMNRYYDIIVK